MLRSGCKFPKCPVYDCASLKPKFLLKTAGFFFLNLTLQETGKKQKELIITMLTKEDHNVSNDHISLISFIYFRA